MINKDVFSSSLESSRELKLEFGYDVPMVLNPKAVLVLKNKSAIKTSFSLSVEYFHAARVPTPPEQKRTGNQKRLGSMS